MLDDIIKTLKINHYIKNLVVFLPIVFSKNILNIDMILHTAIICIGFCLISSAVYIMNDLLDIENDKKHQAEHSVRDTVVEKASENATIDIPSAMVDTEIDRMMSEFEQRLQMQGMNLELYFQFSGQDEAALKDQMKEDAEKRVRSNLTLEAIVAAENIEVTEEEVNAELENMSQMYNMPVDAIKQALGGVENLQMDIKMRKAIDFLVENSKTVA